MAKVALAGVVTKCSFCAILSNEGRGRGFGVAKAKQGCVSMARYGVSKNSRMIAVAIHKASDHPFLTSRFEVVESQQCSMLFSIRKLHRAWPRSGNITSE
jgi:hypothetical protein